MATNATACWRVRPSGSNNNGGGYDTGIGTAASGTHGTFSGATFTDTTAAAFTGAMVGASIWIKGVGQYLIATRIDASNITLTGAVPPLSLSASVANQAWQVGSGQDYSQQNAAQVTQSGGTVSTATTTLTDTGASFTSALIGNAIRVVGTGITTTITFITAVPSSTTLTLQNSPGATGSAVTYNIGGAWADFQTNTTSALGFVVQQNTIYVLGSGTPNPSAYTVDYTVSAATTPVAGTSALFLILENDPQTPGYKYWPDTTGGMPVIQANAGVFITSGFWKFKGLWFNANTTTTLFAAANNMFIGCVFDQVGNDVGLTLTTGTSNNSALVGCELFSSTTAAAGTSYILSMGQGSICVGCNIHDAIGNGVQILNTFCNFSNNIVAKCNGATAGINVSANGTNSTIMNNTVDGNKGSGLVANANSFNSVWSNNIFSNHTVAAKIGLSMTTGTDQGNGVREYNTFYNNTVNFGVNASQSIGAHDTVIASNPYVGQTTENYTLA